MKLIALWILLLSLISCGKPLPLGGVGEYPGGTSGWKTSGLPAKFHVNREYYNKYRSHFEEAQDSMVSKSGKQLIEYVISTDNPKTIAELDTRRVVNGENWIVGKESDDDFPGWSGARGVTYMWKNGDRSLKNVRIIFNHPNLSGSKRQYRAFFLHEMMHGLGFRHFHAGASILSYDWLYADTQEITAVDRELLALQYPFSEDGDNVKDLEKLGYLTEVELREEITNGLLFDYGFSTDRAEEVSSILFYMKKIKGKRSLTDRELDKFTNKLLGTKYIDSKKAMEEYIQGNDENFIKMLGKAAQVNETSPEAMQEIFLDYLL